MIGNSSGVSSTQEYFDHRVLQMTDGIHQLGELRLELLGLLVGAWVIVYFCLWKGVTLTGKVVYITATLPILLLIAFTVRGLSLPGAVDGVLFFIFPLGFKLYRFNPFYLYNSQNNFTTEIKTNLR